MEYYIRLGEIPEDGFSKIHRGDAIMGLEPGVSVYDCCQRRGKWMICIPNPIHPFTMDTLKDFESDVINSNSRKIYLVTGTYVGDGSDGEPCLKDVQIIKDITSEFQVDHREYSFIPKDWVTKKYLPTQEQIIRGLTPDEVDEENSQG